MSSQPTRPFDAILAGRVHIAGGLPTTIPDVPLCVVFLLFFIAGAVLNVRLFIRYGKRLRWQMALFGFCMARITTMVMRIVWSQKQIDGNVAIAAIVFLNAGVIIIFLINMMMSKKALFRTHAAYFAAHPAKKAMVKKVFAALGFLLLAFLIILIVGAVQGFLTTNPKVQHIDTILKRIGVVVFLVYCCLPFIILSFNAIWRLKTGEPAVQVGEYDTRHRGPGIGQKSWDSNLTVWKNSAIILVSASLVTFEYGIKVAQGFESPIINRWYWSKGAFYGAALLPEVLALYLLIFSNMAERYAGLAVMPKEKSLENSDNATLVNENGGNKGTVKETKAAL